MIRLHLETPFLYINPLNINFSNHLITGFDFPQIFVSTTQDSRIWTVLMHPLTELNYMEEIMFVLLKFSLGIIFKIFIDIFCLIWENMFDMTSRIMYLLLPLLSQRLQAYTYCIGLHKAVLGFHGGVWKWKIWYWFSAWHNIGTEDLLLIKMNFIN